MVCGDGALSKNCVPTQSAAASPPRRGGRHGGVGRVTLTLCDNPTVTVFGVSAIEQIDDLAYGIASTTVGYPDAEADIQETRNVSLREQLAGERLGQPLLVACR